MDISDKDIKAEVKNQSVYIFYSPHISPLWQLVLHTVKLFLMEKKY